MRSDYLAIDGSTVHIDADAEVARHATATGWVVSPSLMRAHPFATHPTGYSEVVEAAVREQRSDIEVTEQSEFSLKEGTLRVGVARFGTPTGNVREVTIGAWEGRTGTLTTSLVGNVVDKLVEVFDSLRFTVRRNGIAVDSPVVARPRAPELVVEVSELGIVNVSPATAEVLEHVPRREGARTRFGELFRLRRDSMAMLLVSDSAVGRIEPLDGVEPDRAADVAAGLRIEWDPRSREG